MSKARKILMQRRGRLFRASVTEARLLEHIGVAARVVRAAPVTKAAVAIAESTSAPDAGSPAASDDLASTRAEYFEVIGKRPFPGWAVDALREKIAAHRAER